MFPRRCSLDEDKGIKYSNRVLIGNWFESAKLEEYKLNKFLRHMKKGDLVLARFRKMTENLKTSRNVTPSSTTICFGNTCCLLAPHLSVSENSVKKGMLLGGRISCHEINLTQELRDGCTIVGIGDLNPTNNTAFTIMSADYCDRENEQLKYNQEFLLAVAGSVERKTPLYMRYDPNPVPGLFGAYELYLSENPVSNTRWRVLPKQRPDITRFEQEGTPAPVNTDIVINHCATNINLALDVKHAVPGFYGKICLPKMRTELDIYGREKETNIFQLYCPIQQIKKKEDPPN